MKRFLLTIGLTLCLGVGVFGQVEIPKSLNPLAGPSQSDEKTLIEQRDNLIKSGLQKDAEIQRLKAVLSGTPEYTEKLVTALTTEYQKVLSAPAAVACKRAKGKIFVGRNDKNQPVFAGCLF